MNKEQRRRIEICATRERRDTDPVAVDVRFVPTTGSKRPYEIWFQAKDGNWYQRQSFGSEDKAQAEVQTLRACFKI